LAEENSREGRCEEKEITGEVRKKYGETPLGVGRGY